MYYAIPTLIPQCSIIVKYMHFEHYLSYTLLYHLLVVINTDNFYYNICTYIYIICRSDGSLKEVTFTNVDVTATLPDGVDACDIGTFTIWCQPFTAIFTRIIIPTDIFVSY